MECRSLRRRLSPFARRQVELFFNKVIGENAGTATCSGGGSGPGDLERTLPLVRAGHAVFVQGVVGNLNLPMCFAAECRSIERALVNLFRFRSADRTRPELPGAEMTFMSFETVAGLAMVSSEFAELINAKRWHRPGGLRTL